MASTQYFLIISVWKLWSAQGFGFTGHKYITKKVRVVSLAGDTLKRHMTLWSGVVRVQLTVKETQRTAEVKITVTITTGKIKRSLYPSSGTRTTLRKESLINMLKFIDIYFSGAKKQMNFWSRVVRVPLLVIEETKII